MKKPWIYVFFIDPWLFLAVFYSHVVFSKNGGLCFIQCLLVVPENAFVWDFANWLGYDRIKI